MPREYCRKRNLTDLSLLTSNIKEHQLKRQIQNLFRENRFLTPDGQKVWENLCGFKFPPVPNDIDADSDASSDIEPLYDTFDNEDDLNENALSPDIANAPSNMDNGSLHNTREPLSHSEPVAIPNEKGYRTTRSGKSYCLTLTASGRSILASRPFTSIAHLPVIEAQFPPTPPDLQCREIARKLSIEVGTSENLQDRIYLENDNNKTNKKVLTWNKYLTVRTYEPTSKSIIYKIQSMQSLKKPTEQKFETYFMHSFQSIKLLDISNKEIFWKTIKQPDPNKCLLIHPEDED